MGNEIGSVILVFDPSESFFTWNGKIIYNTCFIIEQSLYVALKLKLPSFRHADSERFLLQLTIFSFRIARFQIKKNAVYGTLSW